MESEIILELDNICDNFSEESGHFELDSLEICDRALSDDFKRIFFPTVYGIITVLGIVGNGLVVVVMAYQKKHKTMTDKYRLHLSVASLLFMVTLPFWAVDAGRSWYFGSFLCVFMHMIYTVNLYGSVFILAFISLDRYLAVVQATNTKQQDKRKLLANRVIYVGVWLPATIMTVPDLVFARVYDTGLSDFVLSGNGSTEMYDSRCICQHIYPKDTDVIWRVAFRLEHILVGFVIPGLVILVCYCIIIAELSKGSKGSKCQMQKMKALKTTVILILSFFSCWLPYCLGALFDTFIMLKVITPTCQVRQAVEKWIPITEAFAYFHCCLNPLLYAFLGVKFKKSARIVLNVSSRSIQKTNLMAKKRGPISPVSTESESSRVLSS